MATISLAALSLFARESFAVWRQPVLPESLYLESQAAVRRGLAYLEGRQLPNGSWADHPVITAMAMLAVCDGNEYASGGAFEMTLARGAQYLTGLQTADGGMANRAAMQYPVYSTAVAVLAIARLRDQTRNEPLVRARKYLIGSQIDDSEGALDYGGFPGISGGYADMITTQWVLEALYVTDHLVSADAESERTRVYQRALTFIRACQSDAGSDRDDQGAFLDSPRLALANLESAVSPATPTNRFLRTAAGIKSLIYGRVAADDPQLNAALTWLFLNLNNSPELSAEVAVCPYTSFFFLGQAMRAVERSGLAMQTRMTTADNWETGAARRLLNWQRGDGSWRPGEQAWWENHPDLVTAYALLTLEAFIRERPRL